MENYLYIVLKSFKHMSSSEMKSAIKPAAETPLSEITFRKYERPMVRKERELSKKLCLSLGLLQPGDSRDVVVDVLHVLLKGKKRQQLLTVEEIEKKVLINRKLHKLPIAGVAPSNIRRQIKRLRALFLVDKVKTKYRISEFSNISEVFSEKVEKFVLPSILDRVKEYLFVADEVFSRRGGKKKD